MKKLLLVLLVVALASFLFVGCLPVTPAEGEGEGEVEPGICPTVEVTSQVAVGGKTYIKAGTQTITVTFAVPTEPVSLWIPAECVEKGSPEGVPDDAHEIVLYADADKKIYTGEFNFSGVECCEFYIYVLTCDTCAPCKYPYIVDGVGPYATIEICIDKCDCPPGCEFSFTSTITEDCVDEVNCDDDCSGFASWSIVFYEDDPFDECCEVPCEEPIGTCSGEDCPILCETACIEEDPLYVVATLVDEVGNETKYYLTIDHNPDTCDAVTVEQFTANGEDGLCTLWTVEVDTPDFVLCEDLE